MKKILVTNTSFAKNNSKPIENLERNGFIVVENTYGRSLSHDEIVSQIHDIFGIIVGVEKIDREIIDRAKYLKIISKFGVGVDNIDVEYAEQKGIKVTRTIGANADAVADTALGLMLSVAKRIPYIDNACRNGLWLEPETFEINHKTLGLIGLGDIGKRVAKRASGFDMRLIAFDLVKDTEFAANNHIEYMDLPDLIKLSDFISIHVPINSQTRNLISQREISLMKETAAIINTARGGVINEEALINALKTKRIFGAGLDVFENEPIDANHWKDLENVVLSSHCAADTYEAINRMSYMAAKNIIDFLRNHNG